jgi:hypothetical protein
MPGYLWSLRTVPTEKRKTQRRALQRRAWIGLADGTTVECGLGNMSETGAKLVFSDGIGALPKEFVLLLAKDGRVARKCRLAWKADGEIGVEFVARRVVPTLHSLRAAAER